MRDKIIGFIISVVCFIISFGFVKGQAMALPFVPTDWTWEMYQGLHMLGDLIANDVNFDIPDWVDFNDFDDVKAFLEMIYNEGKKKVAYASIIADMCVGTWQNFLDTGEVSLPFSESTIKRTHNTGFFQHVVDTITSVIPDPDVNYLTYLDNINGSGFWWKEFYNTSVTWNGTTVSARIYPWTSQTWWVDPQYGSIPLTLNNAYSSNIIHCNKDILDIYITSVNNVYTFDQTFTFLNENGGVRSQSTNSSWGLTSNTAIVYKNESYIKGTNGSDITIHYSSSGTLEQVFTYIQKYFRNVDIYVNGNPWALVGGTAIDNPLGVEIPQNVIDEVENGKISGLVIDATLPDTDNLVGSIDLGVVMDELREAQANGRIATLDGVRTKDGVRAIDGTVVGTVSKAVAIDVPSTASLVTAADEWGYIPYYPEIPSAFSGTTILSELIDATQTIVPNELIMAIWGLVIILFIIALINIFHK